VTIDFYSDLQALKGIWINIVDLVECRRTGKTVPRHPSRQALRNYTLKTKKIFPKAAAKKNGFLTVLLIHLNASL